MPDIDNQLPVEEPVVTPVTPPNTITVTPASPNVSLDPATGLPVAAHVEDPLANPLVAAELAKLKAQISTLSDKASKTNDLNKKLTEAQAKLTEFENAQLSEVEKKEKEFKEAIEQRDSANNAKKAIEIENMKLKAFMKSGLDADFMRFVIGESEEDINESIVALQKLVSKQVQPVVEQPTQEVPAPYTPTPLQTAPLNQPIPQKPKTFTQAEIAKMTPAEYSKNREAILLAAARNEIK